MWRAEEQIARRVSKAGRGSHLVTQLEMLQTGVGISKVSRLNRELQVLLVRGLGGAVVEPKIIPACSFQPFMAEDFLDMANRAAIEEKLSRGCVAQQMGRHALLDSGETPVLGKWPPDVRTFQPPFSICCRK